MKVITIVFLSVILSFPFYLHSQNDTNFIVHDYIPDTVLSNNYDTLVIDIDQNSFIDVAFFLQFTSGGDYAYVTSANTSAWYAYLYSSLNIDSLTSNLLDWRQIPLYWNSYECPEKIGVKIVYGDENYYGWIKGITSYLGDHKIITLDKFAFCKIPNYPLLWGQTEVITNLLEDTGADNEGVKIRLDNSTLMINSKEQMKNVLLTSISGTTMFVKSNLNSNSLEISIGTITHGTYVLSLAFTNGGTFHRKIEI